MPQVLFQDVSTDRCQKNQLERCVCVGKTIVRGCNCPPWIVGSVVAICVIESETRVLRRDASLAPMDRGTVHVHARVDDLKFAKSCIRRKRISQAAAATADVQDLNAV